LLEEVVSLAAECQVSPEEMNHSALEILRIAAMKGFVRVEQQRAYKVAAAR
jgi:hypothetical protein